LSTAETSITTTAEIGVAEPLCLADFPGMVTHPLDSRSTEEALVSEVSLVENLDATGNGCR
jgi:hypothetical protein